MYFQLFQSLAFCGYIVLTFDISFLESAVSLILHGYGHLIACGRCSPDHYSQTLDVCSEGDFATVARSLKGSFSALQISSLLKGGQDLKIV